MGGSKRIESANDIVDALIFKYKPFQKWRDLPAELRNGKIVAISGFKHKASPKPQSWRGRAGWYFRRAMGKNNKIGVGREYEHWGTFLKIELDTKSESVDETQYFVDEVNNDERYAYVIYDIGHHHVLRVKPCLTNPTELSQNIQFYDVGDHGSSLRKLLV